MKSILVISGGDAPGINAALYEYTRLAAEHDDAVFGALGGFAGVLNNQLVKLTTGALSTVMGLGGSYLASSREPVLRQPENRARLVEVLAENEVDNIVLFGGDGTLRHIPPILRDLGIPCIGIPTTIDNDVPGTEQTIGFDTACNFAHYTIDGLLATARALPGRVFSVETLGGNTGILALDIAYAAGAHAVLVPEYPYEDGWLIEQIEAALRSYRCALVVLSEGIRAARTLPEDIQRLSGFRVRDTRLGHGQRGAAPTHRDRRLAMGMARMAYETLQAGTNFGTVTVTPSGSFDLYRGMLAELPPRLPDRALYNFVNGLY